MSWLTPLGFLGLISLIILIIIYIIKPNYQQKIISSTFVWKLSLRYRRKRIPINHFRNIIIFLCQVLILSSCAFILAQPIIEAEQQNQYPEKVAIIDAAASMRATYDDGTSETRFERAVGEVKLLVEEVAANDGLITVILAGTEASYIVQRTGAANKASTIAALDKLIENPKDLKCTYGVADVEGAMNLAQKVTLDNPDTEVIYYTGTRYLNPGKVTVKYVGDENTDWNVSILDVRAIMEENYYRVYVDIACYGIPKTVNVYCDLYGTNYDQATVNVECLADCNGEVKTITFGKNENDNDEVISVYSFDNIRVYVEEEDCFVDDNYFYLYGGTPESIKIEYYSTLPNNFFSSVTMALREKMSSRWTIDLDEIKGVDPAGNPVEPKIEGYDIYIFEHQVPQTIPDDGVVLLINPDKAPSNAGFALGGVYRSNQEVKLSAGDPHPIMNNIIAENITVTMFRELTTFDEYTPFLYCDQYPIGLVKNTVQEKVIVLTLNLNMSNFPISFEFPAFIYNVFEYFFPSTVQKHAFETNETVTFNSRSDRLYVSGPGLESEITTFPSEMSLLVPGIYTTTQTVISGAQVVDNFYVRMPASESEITRVIGDLDNPTYSEKNELPDMDLVFYFALALVALLFVEWWLQSRDQF